MVTQRDVARRAGVSVRTVSNVINDFAWVADETRARVQAAVDELGYRPNLLARGLQRGRSGLLALVLPLDVQYFHDLAGAVVDEAERRGFTVLIERTAGNPSRERDLVSRPERASLFDAIIFSPLALDDAELRRQPGDTPVVLLGEKPTGLGFDRVIMDDAAAAEAVTRHLLEQGRTRIAAIGQPARPAGRTALHRTRGYRRALSAAGIGFDPALVGTIRSFQRPDGAAAMERLLDSKRPPDAVFGYNDLLALGALRTLLSRGIRVPEDIAVAGFDDIEDGRYSTPTLTTIAPDLPHLASQALDLVQRRLDGYDGRPSTRRTGWTLITRESTGVAKPLQLEH
ncbi:LacI family DNA-binding transcriptional regulator [Microlunatus sp. GCM10028923]|uniref:LacI family DNA-binding transcriptional regulator n=1 Tax=Microlunatus sp. GCM10028923 TaxID=3273400 RepID=UPI003607957D